MYSIKQPSEIIFGKYSAQKFDFPENCLLITSKGSIKRGWDEYLKLKDYHFFDRVENNPSMDTVKKIISEFSGEKISKIIGLEYSKHYMKIKDRYFD